MDPCRNVPCLGAADPVSAVTHLVASVAALASFVPLYRRSAGMPWHRATSLTFGASMLLLFAASTAYHICDPGPEKEHLRRLDHAAIYVLIAGTFTPIAGNLCRGHLRWSVLAVTWSLALCGVAMKVFFFGFTQGRFEGLDTACYLLMGWFGTVPFLSILRTRAVPRPALLWMVAAAFFYSAGAVCELVGWPIVVPGVFAWHEVFHFLVMAASTCFYAFIVRHALVPPLSSIG